MTTKSNHQLSLFGDSKNRLDEGAKSPHTEETRLESSFLAMDADELARVIQHHDALYNAGHPEISDALYDRLRQRLEQISPDHPILNRFFESSSDAEEGPQNRQTDRLGKDGRRKVRHEISMLSLGKAYDAETVAKWAEDIHSDLVGSPKLDGLSCSLQYDRDGNLVLASTRGNGEEGDDITPNVRYIKDIPKKIAASNIEVRGEVYMPLSSFKKFEDAAMSPRNLAVGGLKQKDPAETARYGLSYFAYELFGETFATEMEKLARLKELGFIAVEHELIRRPVPYSVVQNREQIHTYFHRMLAERPRWDFDADGIVFKANDVEEQRKLGVTAHHPKHSIAFKFQGEQGETTLRGVDWQVSKTGIITPVANFDMLVLSDAEIQRATLVHAGHVEHFPIFDPQAPESREKTTHLKLGSRILVSRRGGVIPCAEMVMSEPEDGVPVEIPQKCPSCGAETETRYSAKDGIYYLACSDPENCPSTGQALIENYVKVINCMGFGEKIIESLYDASLISTPADLYRLSVQDIAMAISQDNNGQINDKAILPLKLYNAIQGSRKQSLSTFLESLSIPALGKTNSKIVANNLHSLESVLNASLEDLVKAMGITKTKLSNKQSVTFYNQLHSCVPEKNESIKQFITRVMPSKWIRVINLLKKEYKNVSDVKNATIQQLMTHSLTEKLAEQIKKKFENTSPLSDESVEQYIERAFPKCSYAGSSLIYQWGNLEQLLAATETEVKESIENDSIRNVVSVYNGLINRSTLINDLLNFVEVEENTQKTIIADIFKGMTFLFTGTLESMKREEAQARVEALGGTIASGVSKNLSVLVATSNTSSKWKKAEKINAENKDVQIQLWTEDDFLSALKNADK